MKKNLSFLILFFATSLFAVPRAIVSIVPEETFAKKIAKEHLALSVMVQPGTSPHTYEPKPSQMKEIAQSDLYFAIGVEFEQVWLPRFKDLNPRLNIVDVTKGIRKLPMAAHHHDDNDDDHADQHDDSSHHDARDPHVWTAPSNVRIISKNIAHALEDIDPAHAEEYSKNLQAWIQQIDQTDKKIRAILTGVPKGTKFMVFHPSWGYFAHEYGLIQLSVEVEGKAPKPKALIALIKKARQEKVRAIFTQPEFSDASARIIAEELDIPVIKVSPMSADWSGTLIRIAKAIAGAR
jgi:zinc transport system substrate-binding protein